MKIPWIIISISLILFYSSPYCQTSDDLSFRQSLVAPSLSDSVQYPSLEILEAKPVAKSALRWNRQRVIGIGIMTLCTILSYYFHHEAESSYQAYLKSGDSAEMNRLYHRSKQYDRYNGWTYIGLEFGFVITVLSFR